MRTDEVTKQTTQLPETLPDLAKFALIGRDKLKAVRAEIHAIEKVGLAKEVYDQKLAEAQDISEAVTDAEMRMGELIKAMPKATAKNNPSGLKKMQTQIELHDDLGLNKPKSEAIKESGLTQRQAEHFQRMAEHPDSVEKAKAQAREAGDILSRAQVLRQIREDHPTPPPQKRPKDRTGEALIRHLAFKEQAKDGPTDFQDAKQDKEDTLTLSRSLRKEILKATRIPAMLREKKVIERLADLHEDEKRELKNCLNETMAFLSKVKRYLDEG